MPQELDSQFDQLIEQYTDHVCDSMDIGALLDMARDSIMQSYEKMSEHELMDFIQDMEGDEFAADLIGSIYGNFPPDQPLEGRDYTMKDGESITFPCKWDTTGQSTNCPFFYALPPGSCIIWKYTREPLMRCLKFKGHWTLVYHQFKSGRLDTSRLETVINGPSAAELFQYVT